MRSGRLFIWLRDGNVRTHNLHFHKPDDPDYADQITFRNELRSDPKPRAQYVALKRNLVENLVDKGRGQYGDGKTDFVKSVLQKTR